MNQEKIKSATVAIILAIVVIALYQTFVANSNLKKAIETLDNTSKKLDSASSAIKYSKEQVDSLQQSFARFSAYIKDVQGRLERMDLEKRVNEQVYQSKRDSIRLRLKELNKSVDLTGEDLPEVPVFDSKKPIIYECLNDHSGHPHSGKDKEELKKTYGCTKFQVMLL